MKVYDAKPWLKSYDLDVLPEIEIPATSLTELLIRTCHEYPDLPALYFMGTPMTFGELLDRAGRFAKGLQKHGLKKGDVVSFCLPNIPQYLVAVLGTLRAGCTVSGLAPLFSPDEMAYQLGDCSAKALIVMDALFEAKIKPIAERIPSVDLVLVTGVADMLQPGGDFPSGTLRDGKQVMSFVDFVNRYSGVPESCVVASQDACYLQYTGGTTGPPKGLS